MILELGDLSDLADATTSADDAIRDITREFNKKAFTARQILPVLAQALAAANHNYTRGFQLAAVGGIPQFVFTDVRNAKSQLEYLTSLMTQKGSDPYKFSNPHKTWDDVKKAVIAPVAWIGTVNEILKVQETASQQLVTDLVQGVLRLPARVAGGVISYAAETVRQTLETGLSPLLPGASIPSWVVPTAGIGVAAIIALKLAQSLRR